MCALAPGLGAQAPGGPILQQAGPRWLPTLGIRGGWDYRNSDPAIGAMVRLPIPLPVVPLAIAPGGDFVFHDGLTDRQALVDLTANLFGLALGGGPVWLNTVFEEVQDAALERDTRLGWTALVGFRNRTGPFGVDFDLRWVFMEDLEENPRYIMIGLTWTPGAPRPRGFGG